MPIFIVNEIGKIIKYRKFYGYYLLIKLNLNSVNQLKIIYWRRYEKNETCFI